MNRWFKKKKVQYYLALYAKFPSPTKGQRTEFVLESIF